jgi:TolB protein
VTLDGQVERILDDGRLGDPTFSKDNRTVVYWRNDNGSSDGGTLYRISTDGKEPERLTQGGDGVDNDPVISPDGRSVAYRTKRNGRLVIATIALPSFPSSEGLPKQHVLSPEHADDQEPSWSPDGRQIAFIHALGDARQLFVMNANGSGRHPLTDDQEAEAAPAWSSR